MHSVSLRMIWDAVGTLRAPKMKGSPFFWAAKDTRAPLEAGEWLHTQERGGSWVSMSRNAALLAAVLQCILLKWKGAVIGNRRGMAEEKI